jgi:hypothetical protein
MLRVLQTVSVTVSVLTLTFISVDRWYAICFPLKFKSTTGRAKTAIIVIWLLALAFGKSAFLATRVARRKTRGQHVCLSITSAREQVLLSNPRIGE